MEASTTIRHLFSGNILVVPSYQRAYAWDTPSDDTTITTHTDVFMEDLRRHLSSKVDTPYYFGHFLLRSKGEDRYEVIDGQQRLTTIVIFLAALFRRLAASHELEERESEIYEDILVRNTTCRFATVENDNQLFRDYVIYRTKTDHQGLETESAKRIVHAYDYFDTQLEMLEPSLLAEYLNCVAKAQCTTHLVVKEPEAIQMFIFQNNRGKKPSNLEIIKAQIMYAAHLKAGGQVEELLDTIKNRFASIYRSISRVEEAIDEDEVLLYTLRIHFNSLYEDSPIERVERALDSSEALPFIRMFTQELADAFTWLETFYRKDNLRLFAVHSLISLGNIGLILPFVIKAYKFKLEDEQLVSLCAGFERLILRHRLIGTNARLISRLNDSFVAFSSQAAGFSALLAHFAFLESAQDYFWGHWTDEKLAESIEGMIEHRLAIFILWKYENYLRSLGSGGYQPLRFSQIEKPELEHISPTTPTDGEPIAAGYDEYSVEFVEKYIDCLGNYLLISKSHNCSIGNRPFCEKRATYNHLAQQQEIVDMTAERVEWKQADIEKRQEKLRNYVLNNL